MLIYLLTVATLLLLWFWNRWQGLPPGPWGLPIVGFLPWLNPKAPHETLANLAKKYGPIYGLFLGNIYTVVLTDHKLIRKTLARESTTGRAPLYLTHGIMKGNGIICAEKGLWRDQRKFVYGCLKQFGVSKISTRREQMESRVLKEVSDLIKFIKNNGEHKNNEIVLNPSETLKHNVGSLMTQIVFGISFGRNDELWKWLLHLQEEGTKYIGVAGPLNFLPFLRFIPAFKKPVNFIKDGLHKTHKIYLKIIEEQAKLLKISKQKDENFQPDNILQAFLLEQEKRKGDATEKYYSNEQFLYLLADLFGAGLDTTLTSLRWYLLYMANNPHIQTKVQEEIDHIIGDKKPSVDDLCNMPYTEASLSEIQRIRSVVPTGIPHGVVDDMDIDGYMIPKGTMIIPLLWAVHMNEDFWDIPEDFDPARFLNEEGRCVKSEALIPFQTGKRMCVGDELAKMILFLFTCSILQNFDLSPINDTPLDENGECGITLTPKEYTLVFKLRKAD